MVRASNQRNETDRTLFCTSDPDRSGAYLASMYGTGMRMGRPSAPHSAFRHERRTASRLCLDRVALPMTVAVDVEPLDRILVQEVLDGCLGVRYGHGGSEYPAGSVLVPAPPGLPYRTDVENIRTDITVLDLDFLRAVAGLDHRDGTAPLRLLRPRDGATTHPARGSRNRPAGRSPLFPGSVAEVDTCRGRAAQPGPEVLLVPPPRDGPSWPA
ncbi:hypothetical protein [Streptomyces sp. NPDC096012]|uniref:hypothetical protein n=1 Tax=Streptomyces sp. NPDC096012 TaxID=3155684 RepID=UPI00336ACFFB